MPAALTPNVEDIAVIAHLTDTPAADWRILYHRENRVYTNNTIVAKISPHQEALAHAMTTAHIYHQAGIPVTVPLHDAPFDTPVGYVSLWNHVHGTPPDAATITPELLTEAWDLLAACEQVPLVGGSSMLWWGHIRDELALLRHHSCWEDTWNTLERCFAFFGDMPTTVFGHGDGHLGNMLNTKNGLVLIDFDNSGRYPAGWDQAMLYQHVVLQHGNVEAWTHVPVPESDLVMGKCFTSTIFLLRLPESSVVVDLVGCRNQILRDAVRGSRIPAGGLPWLPERFQPQKYRGTDF